MADLPWAPLRDADYDTACKNCEIWVLVKNKADHTEIKNNLKYDRRKAGFRGRALLQPIPRWALMQRDRLEPKKLLPNVAHFERVETFPVVVLFWRRMMETRARHRNPIFSDVLGTSPSRSLANDTLHTLHLGVIQYFICHVFWLCIQFDVYELGGNEETRLVMTVMALRSDIFKFFSAWREIIRRRRSPRKC